MRLPSYLIRNRLGIFCLRVVLPRPLREHCPTLPREMRHSLSSRDPCHAKRQAVQFAAAYHRLLADHDVRQAMARPKPATMGAVTAGLDRRLRQLPAAIRKLMAAHTMVPATADSCRGQLVDLAPLPCSHQEAGYHQASLQTGISASDEWLSAAVLRYRDDMRVEGRWRKDQTWTYAYEPALRALPAAEELISLRVQGVLRGDSSASQIMLGSQRITVRRPRACSKTLTSWRCPIQNATYANLA